MTALIGALNKHGVAIAADSAATIGNGHYDKVYNTANKIFTLSKIHPIGIMICGNAEFKGIPWDIIIKGYRKRLGAKAFDEVSLYVDDFFNYLRNSNLPITSYKIPPKAISQFISDAVKILINKILPKPVGNTIQIPPVQDLCNKMQKEIAELGYVSECDDMFNHIRKQFGTQCSTLAINLCPGCQDSGVLGMVQQLIELFVFALYLRQNSSQLVFVGYGEKEIFPILLPNGFIHP